MSALDAGQVRRAFSRAAPAYRALAVLQSEVRARLLEQLDYVTQAPQRVVDLGSGPCDAEPILRRRWKQAEIIAIDHALPMLQAARRGWALRHPYRRVCADVRALPLATGSADLLFSNLCFQWIGDLGALFAELRRVLRPGGMLCFSTFADGTLDELRAAFAALGDGFGHVNDFAPMQTIGDALLHAGFANPVLDRDAFTLRYADVMSLMRELHGIGAGNARSDRPRGLTGRARMRRVAEAYEPMHSEGTLPARYEVVYAMAWAPEPGQPERAGQGELARFPADRISIRRRPG